MATEKYTIKFTAHARKGLRKLVVEDYIILYKVQNTAGNVLIYRIVNGRTNYMSFFTSKNG